MRKKSLILLCCVLFFGISNAQNNPGYFGRHVLLNMDCSLSPSWKNANVMTPTLQTISRNSSRKYLGLNYFLSPNVEVIVWKLGTVGAGYNYCQNRKDISFHYSDGNYYLIDNTYFQTLDFFTPLNITAHGFNVFYKQYFGESKAPFGHYAKLIFDGYFYNYQANAGFSSFNEEHGSNFSSYHSEGKGSLFGLKAEYGYDLLFFNCLRISMGVTIGTTFGGFKQVRNEMANNFFFQNRFNMNEQVEVTSDDLVKNRILNAYWFGIKLGVGVLTF